MKAAVCLQHVPFEGPGLFQSVLEAEGYHFASHLVPRDGLPESAGDFLLIMGGPMSVNDSEKWIAEETEFIRRAVESDVPCLGICLGSQFLARAAGGSVVPGKAPEIGMTTIRLTEAGKTDPVLGGLPEVLRVFEWHGEGLELPPGIKPLAASALFDVQAFRFRRAYGLLFHMEMDEPAVHRICKHCPDDLARAGLYASQVITEARPHLAQCNAWAQSLLRAMLVKPVT